MEVLAALLAESLDGGWHRHYSRDSGVYGTKRLTSLLESNGGSVETTRDQSSTEAVAGAYMKCQKVSAMLLRASQDGGTPTAPADISPSELHRIGKFVELSTSLGSTDSVAALDHNLTLSNWDEAVRLSWSMKDFAEWANVAMDDMVLDIVMFRLFGTGVLPTAQMECQLVAQRWVDWNLHNAVEDSPAPSSDGGNGHSPALVPVKGGLRRMFSKEVPDLPADEVVVKSVGDFNYIWGGIGGADGKGGLGHGVVYCIDKRWWDEWVDFAGWRYYVERIKPTNGCFITPRSLIRPRELSTERLIDRSPDFQCFSGSRGSYEVMKTSVVKGEDYVLVPPGVWNVLYEMYGGGPPLPRMVLPADGNREMYMNGGVDDGNVKVGDEYVEVIPKQAEHAEQHYPKEIPTSVRVATHPWIVHCQICDPQQPYRRGDAGPLSIRIMAMPDQPLWRLFAEIVVRLPISHTKARDSHGEGRTRLWKFENRATTTGSRYGPWALLCKNRCAEIPIGTSSYDKYEERWETYSDQHSVEGIGITDGMRLMYEFAVASKDGTFTWPREAAARATTARRIADEDANFRLLLRGLDANAEPLKAPIMRTVVDAMDSTGCWYQAIIVNVDNTTITNGDSESDGPLLEAENSNEIREYTHVRVHFNARTGTHEEWIDVKSDRLAVKGRMTSGSVRNLDSDNNGEEANSTSETKSRSATGINKKKDSNEATTPDPSSNAVCLFPSYGACGLINLGNTCYANSGWQCMSYLPLLRSYLLSGQFKINGDINKENPLGTGGKILEEFSDLLHFMWSGKYGARAPQKFRTFLGKCRSQYSGADQQDAQELLNDMFDMLHEDGNRVKKKPYVEALEDKFIEKSELSRVGQEAWRRFLRRNRSAISDLSMGQVYNRVTCPVCNHSSKNFDPFNMLSLPFPTVAEVIFQCTVVRRATALNCPNTMIGVRGRRQQKGHKPSEVQPSPPSKELITEEYLIPMSRLADIGDLKLKLQNLSGIQMNDLRVCKKEDVATNSSDHINSFTKVYTKVSLLPDKEGPCLRLLKQESLDDVTSPTIASIIAFEKTLRVRSARSNSKDEKSDDASTTASEMSNDSASQIADQNKKEAEIAQEYMKVYGDEKECIQFDSDPTLLAKVISRNLWPKVDEDFTLGLRVDAIDHRTHWFQGSVIEIFDDNSLNDTEAEGGENGQPIRKVKVHFDNFSSKWDETYSIESFTSGRVCPLYSHASPRPKPTEFVVHHRFLDRKSKEYSLFGQSFYIQCHNEWSTARAGAHILAQASRFLEDSPFNPTENGKKMNAVGSRERYDARKVISRVIGVLLASDKQYVESAIGCGGKNAAFDVTLMSETLSKKLREDFPLLPFDVRVTAANTSLVPQEEDVTFPFSLARTIGNYMNARNALVLQWRDCTDDSNNSKPMQLLYTPPLLAIHPESRALLDAKQKDELGDKPIKPQPSASHGGLYIGACLTEFCKEQQLEATGCWRCPQCKVDREGKQSMTLWNLPDLLTFHLKRFSASSRWREKISSRVDFPLTGLNMREWCAKESLLCRESNDEAFIYDLVGVVNHHGGMTGGHYVATCKATACSPDGEEDVAYNFNGAGTTDAVTAEEEAAPNSRWSLVRSKEKESSSNAAAKVVAESAEPLWLQFDDDLVEPIPPRNVVSEAAYVLFYRRRRMRPSNIAKYISLG
jgi:ubiquitin C-terminal hydrolase